MRNAIFVRDRNSPIRNEQSMGPSDLRSTDEKYPNDEGAGKRNQPKEALTGWLHFPFPMAKIAMSNFGIDTSQFP
jgi:hypothetical protein